MVKPPVRTITLGVAEPHPLSAATIAWASEILERTRIRYQEAGYEVQTVRIATRPLFDDLAHLPTGAIISYVRELQRMLSDSGLSYCSLGPAQAARPDFPLERLEAIVDMLATATACSMTVQLATGEHGLRYEAVLPTAQIIGRLAQETRNGDGNFRFAMLACMPAGSPFFPAAYHSGPASLTIGLQSASVLSDMLLAHEAELARGMNMRLITDWIRETLETVARPAVTLAQRLAADYGLALGGIDLSPAPMGTDSIVPALELCAGGPLGSAGTLAAAATITAALKSTTLPTCGYCGLMLPVLEDALLGQRWEEDSVDVHRLLLYSAVCGTGLDTIPLAGETSFEDMAALLLDVATLAQRLRKPLSARLFPIPGKKIGERTDFQSPYLINTRIK